MNEVFQSILSNIAIIFLMHLCIDLIFKKKGNHPSYFWPIGIVLLVSTAIIIIFYLPIRFWGFQFDLRLIPLVFLAFKWGYKCALPALLITSSWRLGMGGEGALPGVIFGMVLPVLYALVLGKVKKSVLKPLTLVSLISVSWLISDLPIIFLVPEGWNVFKEISILRFGSFTLTAFTLYFFINSTEKDVHLREQLQYFAERDPLTGLYNIRTFESKIKSKPIENNNRYIVMIDIDHFKSINDKYGHLNGDLILKSVAKVIEYKVSQFKSENVLVGRYGGEEFILYISGPTFQEMIQMAETIRKEIENTTFYTESKVSIKNLTVSIGISEINHNKDLFKAIEQADECLYVSKNNGRNQVNSTGLGAI
ncbi:GGDEF domain-containing protein [Bacillus sp. 31A1R]|uniref:GGDEF domain-containing protein n=1 Tax=Robertmurraya mangrovi TaxID=3098077 RepID=A0ABU5J2W2_9BACI|nr:GGDEF domain-containing protein [Bacillus sp. 31A1R]MDZ5473696.1 GGDEF domain-containing protein [Bacillus sp. 31A1R]